MNVFIIGGSELTRSGCGAFIAKTDTVISVDSNRPESTLRELSATTPPDWVVLLGWTVSLNEVVETIRNNTPRTPNFMLIYNADLTVTDRKQICEAVDLNFKAILSSAADFSVLQNILNSPAQDMVFLSPDCLRAGLPRIAIDMPGKTSASETTRVLEEKATLLLLITQGYSNKEIARYFGATEDQIKSEIRKTMRHLGLHRRTQLATLYLQGVNAFDGTGDSDNNTSSSRFQSP